MRRLLACALLAAALVPLASAQGPATSAPPVVLMPSATFQQYTQLTPHGPVAYSVITAPAPTGLTTIGPVLGAGTVTGPRETLTQLERSVSSVATVAGVNGDFFTQSGGRSYPAGIVMQDGALVRAPTPAHSSIGFDAGGTMHVGRISFSGTWRGTGQRRPLEGINQQPRANQTILFTPAWGASTPNLPNAAVAVLEPFPAAAIGSDLNATVSSVGSGQVAIPSDGAVLVSTGGDAEKLQAEASQGTQVTVRLILPDAWGSVVSALGGGPQLVKGGKPLFTTGENFNPVDLTTRQPRTAVGQLADGRVILVTVDGGRPGYSVGMTSYELAKTMVSLGAVTAVGLQYGRYVSSAFDGEVIDRLSQARQVPVKEALLVQYAGVYAPPPSLTVLGEGDASVGVKLAYRLTRPSTVTANVVAPDGAVHQLDSGTRQPGTYSFTWSSLDVEGTWHWTVQATDDQNNASTADRTFQYDLTLTGLSVPRTSSGGVRVGFTLSRAASAVLSIAAPNGTQVATLPAANLPAGSQSLSWDGLTTTGTKAPGGTYVATVTETSSVGTASYNARFILSG
jgi:Phosphodiester glycosidase/FlgD Ig-like domain